MGQGNFDPDGCRKEMGHGKYQDSGIEVNYSLNVIMQIAVTLVCNIFIVNILIGEW